MNNVILLMAMAIAIASAVIVTKRDIDHINTINPPTPEEQHDSDTRAANYGSLIAVLIIASIIILLLR